MLVPARNDVTSWQLNITQPALGMTRRCCAGISNSKAIQERWQIELFFKWIKQHLKIKTFYNYNENGVKVQIWTAICTYLLVAILKKELKIDQSLYEILQVLNGNVFERTQVNQLFADFDYKNYEDDDRQPLLF